MKRVISVIGLGYVGLPVAVAFGRVYKTIGFDTSDRRIQDLQHGYDHTGEVAKADLKATNVLFTDNAEELRYANFHIIAVPTPVDNANNPDLTHLLMASEAVGKALKRGDIVVYESTVYPGVTENVCAPVLAKVSGLNCGEDFTVGYSPERINPADNEHTFTKIRKVIAGQNLETMESIARVYESVIVAGVYRAPSIKVAEAAKVIENTQRDLNIALMNELSILFDRMGIDTRDVLNAAGTKWNFLNFEPGLVGGHCVGVDPYYLTHIAEKMGYIPQVILAGRRINDSMGRFIAQRTVKEMTCAGHSISTSTVTILGLTFKENCTDVRNSRVIDIIRELMEYGIAIQVNDPLADSAEVFRQYNISLTALPELQPAEAIILAVPHRHYQDMSVGELRRYMKDNAVLIDVKGIYDRHVMANAGMKIWQL